MNWQSTQEDAIVVFFRAGWDAYGVNRVSFLFGLDELEPCIGDLVDRARVQGVSNGKEGQRHDEHEDQHPVFKAQHHTEDHDP